YLLLRDRRGELCAASFAALSGRWDPGISAVLFGRAASASSLVSRAFNPSLVCGLVRGPQSPILLQEGRDAAVWMPRLVDQIERHAAASGMATTFRTTQDQQLLSRLLRQRGYAEGLGLPVAR